MMGNYVDDGKLAKFVNLFKIQATGQILDPASFPSVSRHLGAYAIVMYLLLFQILAANLSPILFDRPTRRLV